MGIQKIKNVDLGSWSEKIVTKIKNWAPRDTPYFRCNDLESK